MLLYSSCSSIVICILSVLYSYFGVSDSEKIENVNGNINKVSKTDVALINIDNSEDFLSAEPPNCECGGIVDLEWTVLEILVVGIIGLVILSSMIKAAFHLKNLIQKHLEKIRKRKSNLELQLHNKIEREMADRGAADSKPNQICRQNTAELEQEPDRVITYP